MPRATKSDYDAVRLRAIARQSHDAGQTRRFLALAAIYEGAMHTEAAAIDGVTRLCCMGHQFAASCLIALIHGRRT